MSRNRLREYRIRQLLTQEQLAEKAGVSVAVIFGAESEGRLPRDLSQERLAIALGIPRDELFPEPDREGVA